MKKKKIQSLLDMFGKALNPSMYGAFETEKKSSKKLKRID